MTLLYFDGHFVQRGTSMQQIVEGRAFSLCGRSSSARRLRKPVLPMRWIGRWRCCLTWPTKVRAGVKTALAMNVWSAASVLLSRQAVQHYGAIWKGVSKMRDAVA